MKDERATRGAVQRLMEDEEGVSDMLDYATIGSNYSICMMRWGSLKKHIVAHV